MLVLLVLFILLSKAHFFCPQITSPQIATPKILGLIPQTQIRKFLRCVSLQIANPQICNDLSANTKSENFCGVPVRKLQIRKFAREKAVFPIPIHIG
jgi:hypothetical protein